VIELADGFWIAPEHITFIKRIDDNKCLMYFVGQSSLEGHVLPFEAGEVAEVVNEYFSDGPVEEDVEEDED